MERNWKEVRSEVKRFVEEEVYPAESIPVSYTHLRAHETS